MGVSGYHKDGGFLRVMSLWCRLSQILVKGREGLPGSLQPSLVKIEVLFATSLQSLARSQSRWGSEVYRSWNLKSD